MIKESMKNTSLLSSPLIDRTTKTNAYSYYVVYSTLIIFWLYLSISAQTWPAIIAGLLLGWLFWSLIEYLMHRFLFHWQPRNAVEKILVFILHDVHHTYPRDVSRSITPLFISLPLAILFYMLFKLLFGKYVVTIFPGFLLGYLIYTVIHDSTHHFPMRFSLGKQLKRHHMHHHYFDNTKNFGVSTPLWDHVFGTYAEEI